MEGKLEVDVLHWRAGCFPQEQVASLAHTHSPLFRPQQVILDVVIVSVGRVGQIVLDCGLEQIASVSGIM